MSFEEREEWQFWGFNTHCTQSQQREILARSRAAPEYRRWCSIDYQVKYGSFDATSDAGKKLCEDLTAAEVGCSIVVLRIITDVLR